MEDTSTPTFAPALQWVAVGAGRIALTHRPKLRALPEFRTSGCTRLVTMLSAHEGAERIGALAREAGLAWTWLPLGSSRTVTDETILRVVDQTLRELAASLTQGESQALHCSAGIHRTGIIAYALLRACGLTPDQAFDAIERARPLTRADLTGERLRFAESLAARATG